LRTCRAPGKLDHCRRRRAQPYFDADAGGTAGSAGVESAHAVGWSIDSLEAQAFAYLAVRSLRGLPLTFPGTTGAPRPVTGGVLAKP
jgi:1,6-anhydro-N-acetylmuramate kinase